MINAVWSQATITATANTPTSRMIGGIAVPWNVQGRVADGTVVVFHPGSLDAAARPVVLRDHDRNRPIGRVVDAADTGTVLTAMTRIAPTPAGDEALVLAAPPDQVLGMWSVGAEPTEFSYDADGVLHVYAADWQELSLLPIGAYTTARVNHVAASRPDQPGGPMPPTLSDDPTTTGPADPDEVEPNEDIEPDEPAAEPIETRAVPVPIAAAAGRRPGRPANNLYEHLTMRALAGQIATARGGDERAARYVAAALAAQGAVARGIEAALADITLVGADNIGALHRPAYQAELVELISWGTPLIDALRAGDLERGDYPQKTFNRWEKAPEIALQPAEKDEIHSVPVKITPTGVPVMTWAGGGDISQPILDLGSPSFVEDYIRAAGVDYARKSDTYAVTTLMAAATDVVLAPSMQFIAIVGALVAALSPATTPPGGLFLAMSYDMGVSLIGVPRDQGPAFWDGNINFGAFTPSVTTSGLSAFVDPNMPARSFLLGHRQGATWYDLPGVPFNLRAVNVGLLGLDVAVYGYGALGIQYPGSFAKTNVPT